MKKLLIIPILFVLGCVIAGIYGCLHDQISYTVSPEYYTHFKFYQFRVPAPLHNRLGAALVGWQATWWMGIVIGLFVIPSGLTIKGWRNYFIQTLLSFGVVALTAFLIGVGALVVSLFTINAGCVPAWPYPVGLTDQVSFARAGTMHNFSYLGGLIGIVTGITYLVIQRRHANKASDATSKPAPGAGSSAHHG